MDASDPAGRDVKALTRLATGSGLALMLIASLLIFAFSDDSVGPGVWVVPVGLLGLVAALLLLGALSGLRRPGRRRLSALTQEEAAAQLPGAQIRAGILGIISSGIQIALSFFSSDGPSAWWFVLNAAVIALSCWLITSGRRQRQRHREREQSQQVAGSTEA